MENDFLILDVTKSAIVEHAKNRIEELFGVKVGFQNCENGEISCVLQKIDASKSSFEAKVSNFNAKIIITLEVELHSLQISIALVSQMLSLLHLFPLGLPCSIGTQHDESVQVRYPIQYWKVILTMVSVRFGLNSHHSKVKNVLKLYVHPLLVTVWMEAGLLPRHGF